MFIYCQKKPEVIYNRKSTVIGERDVMAYSQRHQEKDLRTLDRQALIGIFRRAHASVPARTLGSFVDELLTSRDMYTNHEVLWPAKNPMGPPELKNFLKGGLLRDIKDDCGRIDALIETICTQLQLPELKPERRDRTPHSEAAFIKEERLGLTGE